MKKGMWFELFFLFLTFIVLTSALIVVSNKDEKLEWIVGERAFMLIDTEQKAEKSFLYLDQAAEYAGEKALVAYMQRKTSSCGNLRGTPRWNSMTEKCFPLTDQRFQEEFLPFFRGVFDSYLREAGFLPGQYYMISYFDSQGLHIVGKSDISLTLRITDRSTLGLFPDTDDFISPPLGSLPRGTRFSFMVPKKTGRIGNQGQFFLNMVEAVVLKAGTLRDEGYWVKKENVGMLVYELNAKGYDVNIDNWMDKEVSLYDWRTIINDNPDLFVTDSTIAQILENRAPAKTVGNYSYSLGYEGLIRIPEKEMSDIEDKAKNIIIGCSGKDAPETEDCVRSQIDGYSIYGESWGFGPDCGVDNLDPEEAVICVRTKHSFSGVQFVLNFSLDLSSEAKKLIMGITQDKCADGTPKNSCSASYLCESVKDPITGISSLKLVENCFGYDNIRDNSDDCLCSKGMYCSPQKTCQYIGGSNPLNNLGLSVYDKKWPGCQSNNGFIVVGWCDGSRVCSYFRDPSTGFETYQLVENCNGYDGVPGTIDDCPCSAGTSCIDGKCVSARVPVAKPPQVKPVCNVQVGGVNQEIPPGACYGSSKCREVPGSNGQEYELVPDCLGDHGTPDNPECHCPEFFRCTFTSLCEFESPGITLSPVLPVPPSVTSCGGTQFNDCRGHELCYSDGVFRPRCDRCGCPDGESCEGSICVKKRDCGGIVHGKCSGSASSPGMRCDDGVLKFDCSCCPGGTVCNKDKDACIVPAGKDVIVLDTDSVKQSTFTILDKLRKSLEANGLTVLLARDGPGDPLADKARIDSLGGDYYFQIEEGAATKVYYFKYGEWIGRVVSGFIGCPYTNLPKDKAGKLKSVKATAIRIVFSQFSDSQLQAFDSFVHTFFKTSISDLSWDFRDIPRPSSAIDRVDIGMVYDVSKEAGIDYRILGGLIGQESGFNSINRKGDGLAHGLGQMFNPAVSQVESKIKDRFPELKSRTPFSIYDDVFTSWDDKDLEVQVYASAQYLLWVKDYLENKYNVGDLPIEAALQGYHDGQDYIKEGFISNFCKTHSAKACDESMHYVPRIEEKIRYIEMMT